MAYGGSEGFIPNISRHFIFASLRNLDKGTKRHMRIYVNVYGLLAKIPENCRSHDYGFMARRLQHCFLGILKYLSWCDQSWRGPCDQSWNDEVGVAVFLEA